MDLHTQFLIIRRIASLDFPIYLPINTGPYKTFNASQIPPRPDFLQEW
jgi:hypothetical protein